MNMLMTLVNILNDTLPSHQVSDVSALTELLHLQTLYLDGTGVTERSLEPLARHPSLAALSVAGIAVQDPDHALHLISGEAENVEVESVMMIAAKAPSWPMRGKGIQSEASRCMNGV